jgi:hypothetical protein
MNESTVEVAMDTDHPQASRRAHCNSIKLLHAQIHTHFPGELSRDMRDAVEFRSASRQAKSKQSEYTVCSVTGGACQSTMDVVVIDITFVQGIALHAHHVSAL